MEYKTIKANYKIGLYFQNNLNFAKEKSLSGIQANLNIGRAYQECADKANLEDKENALNKAASYYRTALDLAKNLNEFTYVNEAIRCLKSIGKDEITQQTSTPNDESTLITSINGSR